MISRITVESWPLFARIRRRTPSSSAEGSNPRLSTTVAGPIRARAFASPWRVHLVELRSDILGEEQTNVRGVALELAVGEGSVLKLSEPSHAVVRLSEDAQPKQSDRDDQ
jgi:hypothetical protein